MIRAAILGLAGAWLVAAAALAAAVAAHGLQPSPVAYDGPPPAAWCPEAEPAPALKRMGFRSIACGG